MMKILTLALNILPKLKSYIFADGKFRKDRAVILLITLFLLILSIKLFGIETVITSIEMLDEVSDILGYE